MIFIRFNRYKGENIELKSFDIILLFRTMNYRLTLDGDKKVLLMN